MNCQFCNSPLKLGEDEVFTCGSFTWKSEWRRTHECQLGEKILNLTKELSESNEYARKLNLKIADLCKERDELKAINHRANLDWAEDDTRLREMCLKVGIPQSLIDGDENYVPHITGLGELLVEKIERMRSVGNELMDCANQIGYTSSENPTWIRRAEKAVKAWSLEVGK